MLRATVYAIIDGLLRTKRCLTIETDTPETFMAAARTRMIGMGFDYGGTEFEFGPIGPPWRTP